MVVERALGADRATRRQLAVLLGRLPEATSSSLLVLLGDERSEVREAAAWALGRRQIDDGSALALSGAVLDPDSRVASQAVRSLLAHGRSDLLSVPVLLEGVEGRRRLAAALPGLESTATLELALAAWRASDPNEPNDDSTREHAAATLYQLIAGSELVEWGGLSREIATVAREMIAVAGGVDTTDQWVGGWGAGLLGKTGEASDLAILEELIEHPSSFVRAHALGAVELVTRRRGGRLDSTRLLELLDDPSARAADAALVALGGLIDDARVRDALYARWAELSSAGSAAQPGGLNRVRLLQALSREAQDARLLDLVVEAAHDPSPEVRATAIEVAGRIAMGRVVELGEEDRSPLVRFAWLKGQLSRSEGPLQRPAIVSSSVGAASRLDHRSTFWIVSDERLAGARAKRSERRAASSSVSPAGGGSAGHPRRHAESPIGSELADQVAPGRS